MTRKRHRIDFSRTATSHVAEINDWWLENRTAAPDLFHDELAATVELLAGTPNIGTAYKLSREPDVRRIVIGRSRYHVYWRLDAASRTVTIMAVWHSAREKGPPL